MAYRNDSLDAILAMERDRTGNYGNDCFCENDLEEVYNSYDEWDYADSVYDEMKAGVL